MSEAVFFRLLQVNVEDKAAKLGELVYSFNRTNDVGNVYQIKLSRLKDIHSSPFSYWSSDRLLELFATSAGFGEEVGSASVGMTTSNDFKFVRLWWEVQGKWLAFSNEETESRTAWVHLTGGVSEPYYRDIHLVVNWSNQGEAIHNDDKALPRNEHFYFLPGLTQSLRASRFSPRSLPRGSIFTARNFLIYPSSEQLALSLAVLNSAAYDQLFKLLLGREGFPEFIAGVLLQLPWVQPSQSISTRLVTLARRAHDLQREGSLVDETTHVFQLPGLAARRSESLIAVSLTLAEHEAERAGQFAAVQAQIDEIVFELYGLDDADRQLVIREMGTTAAPSEEVVADDGPDEDDEAAAPENLPTQVLNLLMWCVGAAFGRWDVRKAFDPSLFAPLPEPFDPLPRCAPGALMNADGLSASPADVPDDYPLPVAWEGILVDDPTQEADPRSLDIVARVRGVLTLLWGEDRADSIEAEICRVLGYRELRAIFRDARQGVFAFHIKRYSKSRRKAPIYWLLQTGVRSPNYGMWLYYPRMDNNTLFIAEDIAYKKIQRETFRLNELKQGIDGLDRVARKQREADIAAQTRLVDEVTGFHSKVRQLANSGLPPDHNDGVLISIAPLHELVPWKESAAMWTKLTRGEYTWSTMSQRMNTRGLITGKG